jgi:transposase
MDVYRVPHTKTKSASRWQGTSPTIESRDRQRDFVGSAHRSAVERYAGEISTIPNLPSTAPRMGALREIARNTRSACQRPRRSRQVQLGRMFHRRNLCGGEKRGSCIGKTKRGKGSKLMAVADRSGFPLAIHIASAAPHEITLVRETLQSRFLRSRPQRLIGDRAYDSDALDRELQQNGIEIISPHKSNRIKPRTQDGRALRRYTKRWRIERLFAWMHNFRRLVVRYEYHAENYLGFVHLACIIILLRRGF